MLDCAARYKFKGAFPAAVLGKKYLGGPRPVSRNVVWGSSAEGPRIEAPKASTGMGSGEGVSPSPVGLGSGEGPRKILAFSPSKWCILMHSGARFRPT